MNVIGLVPVVSPEGTIPRSLSDPTHIARLAADGIRHRKTQQQAARPTELDSDSWVGEVKRIRGKRQPLTAAGVQGLRDEYIRTIVPARALGIETLKLERALSGLVNQAYALTPAEIELMWQIAPPRMPIPPPESSHRQRL